MILFANHLPSLRLVGYQHLHHCKYLVSHTQLWTGIFSIGEKKMKHGEKFRLVKKERKKKTKINKQNKTKKKRKRKQNLWHVGCCLRTKFISPHKKDLGHIRNNDQCGLQTAQCELRSSGSRKQLKYWSVVSVYVQLEDSHTVPPTTPLFKAKLFSGSCP